MPGYFVTLNAPDYDGTGDGAYGYRIGDKYVLTAGHVFFDWNGDSSNPTIDDIVFGSAEGNVFFDYRGYRSQYLIEVNQELGDPPYPTDQEIEQQGDLPRRDTVAIQNSGTLAANGHGLVVFLNPNDLSNADAAVGVDTNVYRDGHTTHLRIGTVSSVFTSGALQGVMRITTQVKAQAGDSGGALLLRTMTDNKYYVIGTVSAKLNSNEHITQGTYFSYQEWKDLNDRLATGQTANVTSTDPQNLVVGSTSSDTVQGSFRADLILGRGGDDVIDDGDAPGDTVWANDTLIGGADNDTFKVGAGNDTIWGGDKDDDQLGGGGTDTVDYNALTAGIVIRYYGTGDTVSLTVADGTGGTDTLHSIEVIKATAFTDRFEYSGLIPDGYQLTVDMAGNPDTYLHFGSADDGMNINNGVITNTHGGGTITLLNVGTQIYGTIYDDEITDTSDSNHVINAGWGDDVVTVDGGDSMIRGGLGDDTITAGSGNDRLFGEEGTDIVHGGDGSDFIENGRFNVIPGSYVVDEDELHGDAGADYLHATNTSADAIFIGGAGNDVLDARDSVSVTVRFGEGDGHDMILSDRVAGDEVGPPYDGVDLIDMSGIFKSGVTIIWNPTLVLEDHPPDDRPEGELEQPGFLIRQGDLVIRIDATGDTILIHNIRGLTTYIHDASEASSPPFDHRLDAVDLHELTEMVQFADGPITYEDFLGANPVVKLEFGSVAQYATALDEYHAATDAAPGANDGTPGDDDMNGSGGDDDMAGGDGNDSFASSGGNDTIDGGAGTDTLRLFGALADFTITRDAATGAVILEDKTGLEGKITVKGVEKIYFATDNADFAPGDLVGFWGTENDDALVQGNERDNLIYGLAGNDLLKGLAGNDMLDGGAGADTMQGGTGNDVYLVDQSGDVVTEAYNAGSDEVRTALASYTLGTNVERLTGLAATGQNLTGNSLANILTGGAGADVLNGGSGSDTAAWSWSEAGVTVDLQNNILSGDAAGDTLISIENLTGGSGADTLSGTSAANVLDGGGGADLLTGRGGNDIYYVDSPDDVVVELAGQGNDEIRTSYYYWEATANVETLRFVGVGSFTGVGGDGNDLIYGGNDGDELEGGAGYDTLIGGAGNDDLIGGADGDVLDGGLGGDYLEGGTGDDVYRVDDEGDEIVEYAGEGIDQVYALIADYTLPDEVENLTGNLYEDMHLVGNGLANVILGGGLYDTLEGMAGNDELRGGGADDVLDGGDGDDLLVGGDGIDELTGGAGADTFRYGGWDSGTLGSADRITDFVAGEDRIDLAGIDAGFWTPGQQHFAFIGSTAFSNTAGELRYSFDGTDTYVQADWDGDGAADIEIVLTGQIVLAAADFIL
jgi:Ca2+-binding RTX toxin-like protein